MFYDVTYDKKQREDEVMMMMMMILGIENENHDLAIKILFHFPLFSFRFLLFLGPIRRRKCLLAG